MVLKFQNSSRIVLDVTASLRWVGAPNGIVRVEREVAQWIRANVANKAFVFFDPDRQAYRELNPEYADALLAGQAALDTTGLSDPTRSGRHALDRIPDFVRPAVVWTLRFPHMLLRVMERARLSHGSGWLSTLLDRTQRAIMSAKQRAIMIDGDKARRPHLPLDMACGPELHFTTTDLLLWVGSGWLHTNVRAIRALKERSRFRLVLLSHDIIPLLFPQYYRAHDVEAFRDFYDVAIPLCDLTIFSTQAGERDARTYFAKKGQHIGRSAIAAMGFKSFDRRPDDLSLPSGLTKDRYILYVSTIEPRKGHEFIFDVWLRLIAADVPRATGFKLVFVGRMGWQMERLSERLQTEPASKDSLLVMSGISDDILAALYENAAFCIYPSMYEGYGLPLVETFAYGKTLVSSTGGALAEVAGDFALCLDPQDAEGWYRALKSWMEDPQLRRPYEAAIRQGFSHPGWPDVAERLVSLALSLDDAPNAR